MRLSSRVAAGVLVLAVVVPIASGCSKDEPRHEPKTVRFSHVPLTVDVPPGWSQTLNTARWIMYRPDDGGALVAMSGEKQCSTVEKRLFSALLDLGLTEVTWKGAPRPSRINGLPATVAEGEAVDGKQRCQVEYAIVRAPERRGCLLCLVAVWQSRATEHEEAAAAILRSVHPKD